MSEAKTCNIRRCARCGEDHDQLVFIPFVGIPVEDRDGVTWNLWSLCPVTGDPILMAVLSEDIEIHGSMQMLEEDDDATETDDL